MFSRALRIAASVALAAFAACMVGGLAIAYAEAPRPVAPAAVIYSQPPSPAGGLLYSSLREPDGSATDQWTWDDFVLGSAQTITEVRWRGVYDPARLGLGGPVYDFTVDIYPTIVAGGEPDIAHPPLVHYELGGNAGETPAGVVAGVPTYDYGFVLPTPFQAAAGTKYWVQIEAWQYGTAGWGLAKATGGNGHHFEKVKGNSSIIYRSAPGDAAFTLLGPGVATYWLYLPLLLRSTGG